MKVTFYVHVSEYDLDNNGELKNDTILYISNRASIIDPYNGLRFQVVVDLPIKPIFDAEGKVISVEEV